MSRADQDTNAENPKTGVNAVGRNASVYEQQFAVGALGQLEPTRAEKQAGDYTETHLPDTIATR